MDEKELIKTLTEEFLSPGTITKVSKKELKFLGIDDYPSIVVDYLKEQPKIYYVSRIIGRSSYSKVKLLTDSDDNLYALKITTDEQELSPTHITCLKGQELYFGSFYRIVSKTRVSGGSSKCVTFKKNYIVQKYVPGFTIRKYFSNRLQDDTLSDFKYIIALFSLLELRKLHKLGYLHRDIKFDNVMLDVEKHSGLLLPVVKLIDFGCCCVLENGSYIEPEDGISADGLFHQAPETNSPSRKFSVASDIYSLGYFFIMHLGLERVHWGLRNSARDLLIISMLAKEPEQRPEPEKLITHLYDLSKKQRPEYATLLDDSCESYRSKIPDPIQGNML